jgi:Outer membrane protein beta-barrel domain
MRIIAILFGMILLASVSASAQRADVFGEYSYLHFSPTIGGLSSRSFNGGGGGADLYFLKIFGIKADFMQYASTTFTRTYPTPVIVAGRGAIPAGTYTTQGDMFTYLFGPVLRIPLPKVKPFGEVLFGGSSTDAYVNLTRLIDANGGTILSQNQHPFTLAAGGGVDVSVSHRLAIRLGEFDYILTRYSNPLTNTNNQSSFRYTGGVVLKF